MPRNSPNQPIIYVHAKGHRRASDAQLQALVELRLPLCSRIANQATVKTRYGYDQPLQLLAELADLYPDRPIVFLRAGLQLSSQVLEQLTLLQDSCLEPLALTLLSNADLAVNPFAGLRPPAIKVEYEPAELVSLLAPGHLHTLTAWTDHFVLLSVKAVACLTNKDPQVQQGKTTLMQQLAAVGGSLKVADHLFLHDPQCRVFAPLQLKPHESVQPPPFSELSARVQDWCNSDIVRLPPSGRTQKSATLHITHSWGGGVALWLQSFIQADSRQVHFQLCSEEAKSNTDYGQKLSLYAGNELRCAIASWWLQPPISSIVEHNPAYQAILSEICLRYGIGRVFVSSLIGHSLDALRSSLPTVQILHDHFPLWPLLSADPKPFLKPTGGVDLERAFVTHNSDQRFSTQDVAAWSKITAAYTQAVTTSDVKIVAPGDWVLVLQKKLEPGFKQLTNTIIPHGFPALAGGHPITPRPRKDGRLRMVVLGRMQPGKGQQLLFDALPELVKYVQVYLLGTGKSGQKFFGYPGIDVILEYQRDELTSLLSRIGPDFAALLSIVPETFSYTLSELQQLQIPSIATRIGSFPHRIENNKSGWLIATSAAALNKQVAALCKQPEKLATVRRNLAGTRFETPGKMVKAYNGFCPAPKRTDLHILIEPNTQQIQWGAADYQRSMAANDLQAIRGKKKQLNQELKRRSEWAQKTSKELKLEQRRRKHWVAQLETDISKLQLEVEQKSAWALKANEQVQQERTQGKAWLKQISQLSKKVESRSAWALKTGNELKLEQQRRKKWVAQLETDISRLQQEVENRTEWALATAKELEFEQQRREQWVGQLEIEITTLQQSVAERDAALENANVELANNKTLLDNKDTQLAKMNSRLRQLESDYQVASQQNTLFMNSLSWKITRPLRASRRVAKNFRQARAWNPLRWPWAVAQLLRNLSTRGLKGTLLRLQRTATQVEKDQLPAAIPILHLDGRPIRFETIKQPVVSIVIPVYNQWDYTAGCLRSLLEAGSKYTFEVIIVDDQSSDQTAAELALIEGILHLRNSRNLGFVGSCNRGAGRARGQFLVLLNNDTQVMKGWLDELIDTFKREPEAGLVGARLVYPDGRLQEAGGIVFSDGSGWNYGRNQDAECPEYQFLRESDYCSGACIALKTDFFHQLGDLDTRYAPAYYEDTDLAFRVREAGFKVLIQPLAIVVHFEGITSGTDTANGIKKFQRVNQQKFLARWQNELATQPTCITNVDDAIAIRHASRHRGTGNILFIDATTPEPDQDSGSVRLTNLLQICRAMGYNVTFFADNRAYAGRYTRELQRNGIEVLYDPWLASLQDFFSERGAEYDYIFISRHYVAINYLSLLKRHCPKARFIFDTVDLHYLREQRLAELEQSKTLKSTARQTRRSELSVIKAADATLVVSSIEKALLAKDAAGEQVHVLSNIHEVPGRDKNFAQRKDLFFVGGYQHPPNIDAACWFVNEIWPLIHQQLPELKFHLIGSKAPPTVSALHGNGVIFHGYVPSLDPFLSGCRLAVAPLRYGAGVKGKVNMSMAHGQPVVASPAAVEGMFAEHEREILVAEDARSFAREVVRLHQDEALWNRLSDASVQNVEAHFSVNAARNSLTELFTLLEK